MCEDESGGRELRRGPIEGIVGIVGSGVGSWSDGS